MNRNEIDPRDRPVPLYTVFLVISLIALIHLFLGGMAEMQRVSIETQLFTRSSRELRNPNRGGYHIYPVTITDEEADYGEIVEEYCRWDPHTTLALVQINLQNYREGGISQAGLENISALLDAWARSGKRMIVRFLYDLDGENLLHEPEKLDTVLRHMEQTGPLLLRHAGAILTLQGLFVGDWGELHHTKFSSDGDLRRLAQTLARVTGGMYLAVRTPAQWRTVTRQGTDRQLASRLGLFNDGLLGSGTDMGTYDMAGQGSERRTRDEELAFQGKLCTGVPNGGEVITDNPCNDFENAVRDLSAMRVTYLNQDYDQAVFDKWAAVTVSGRGCCDGLDGLSYIRRHLGYRLLITQAAVSQKILRQEADVAVSFRNEGFAPLYVSPELTLTLQEEESGRTLTYPVEHDLRDLSGGEDAGKIGTARAAFPLEDLAEGVYRLYLDLKDPASGLPVLLANEQEREENGYFLGSVAIRQRRPVLYG